MTNSPNESARRGLYPSKIPSIQAKYFRLVSSFPGRYSFGKKGSVTNGSDSHLSPTPFPSFAMLRKGRRRGLSATSGPRFAFHGLQRLLSSTCLYRFNVLKESITFKNPCSFKQVDIHWVFFFKTFIIDDTCDMNEIRKGKTPFSTFKRISVYT